LLTLAPALKNDKQLILSIELLHELLKLDAISLGATVVQLDDEKINQLRRLFNREDKIELARIVAASDGDKKTTLLFKAVGIEPEEKPANTPKTKANAKA
jgi:hypothetical protein